MTGEQCSKSASSFGDSKQNLDHVFKITLEAPGSATYWYTRAAAELKM